MSKLNEFMNFLRRQPRWRWIVAGILVLLAGGWWFGRGGSTTANIPTFTARRGPLEINVLEGGSLEALESQEVKCEVRVGYQGTKILRIVDEGYLVTDEDVKNGKILCELDSSDLEKQIAQQEIQYQQAVASLIDAQQNYEIQVNQNQSDIKTAEQKARFARMDFDKYLGATVTEKIIKDYGLDKVLAATNDIEQASLAEEALLEQGDSAPAPKLMNSPMAGTAATNVPPVAAPNMPVVTAQTATNEIGSPPVEAESSQPLFPTGIIDFTEYASLDALGDGEAKQKLRKYDDDLQTAQKELGQAQATLEGTKRLYEKQFVAQFEMVRDQLAQDSANLKVKTAETDKALFLKYDFPKAAEQSLSSYTEAVRELDKARRVAISKLAQAKAKLKSAQGQYSVQSRQRNDFKDQLAKCTMRAQKSGLVVYGGGSDRRYYGNEEPIREGASVRERQSIITIPDMTRMSVNVKIHESYIQKIKKGQKARITVDAYPDKILTGEVTKVGVLPDSQNRWMNPDLKVYDTSITIDGTYDWVKPGMSAKVEILVNKLADVVYIPVQAVNADNGKQVCYVASGFKPERREVEVGDFNDEFIEIKKGLREGEQVLLRAPDGVERGPAEPESKPADSKQEKTPAVPANTTPATKKA